MLLLRELSTGTSLSDHGRKQTLYTMHIFIYSCTALYSAHTHIEYMLLSHLTFVTEQTAPVGVTHTLPGIHAGAMVTAWKRLTLVTQITLPAIITPKKIRVEEHDGCVCVREIERVN